MALYPFTKLSESEALMKDGTILRTKNVLDLYYDGIQSILLGEDNKKNPIFNHLNKSFKNMLKRDEEKGGAVLKWIDKSVKELSDYSMKQAEANVDFLTWQLYKELFDWQKNVFDKHTRFNTLLGGRRCFGKGTLILMADGSCKPVEDIAVGDYVMGIDSTPRRVISTTSGEDSMYKVESTRGDVSFVCNSKHTLTLKRTKLQDGRCPKYKLGEVYDIPIDEFLALGKKVRYAFSLYVQKIEYAPKQHIIDPYLLGLWLGDGFSHTGIISVGRNEREIVEYLDSIEGVFKRNDRYNYTVRMPALTERLKKLGVLKNKHIPKEYITDSSYNRLRLLAGLIDSDGYKPKDRNMIEFVNTNKRLIDGFVELCRSLGFHTSIRTKIPKLYGKPCARCWTVSIKGKLSDIPNIVSRKRSKDSKQGAHYNFDISPIGKGVYYGFTTEGDGRILLSDYTVNHNCGKSFYGAIYAVIHCLKGFDEINGYTKPRSVLIMGLTIQKCADVFWQNLQNAARITSHKVDNSSYTIEFSNGATISLAGNASKNEREKQRGMEYSLIIIDECQSQQSLGYLMTDIFGPIIKGRSSEVFLFGTGSITNKGYWKEICENPNWRHFSATMADNPTIPKTAFEDVLKENGWDEDNITFRREYLAENIVDTTRLVYPSFYQGECPNKIATHLIIGIDYGWSDNNAFVPLIRFKDGTMYETDSICFNHSAASDIAEQAKELYERLSVKYKIPKENVLCLADTSDQSISQDIQNKGVPVQNAYKVDKNQQIRDMRKALANGTLILSSENICNEVESYVWKYNEETKSVIYETDDDFFHPDLLDACRYAYYYCSHL